MQAGMGYRRKSGGEPNAATGNALLALRCVGPIRGRRRQGQ